jgi:hypothetical protein
MIIKLGKYIFAILKDKKSGRPKIHKNRQYRQYLCKWCRNKPPKLIKSPLTGKRIKGYCSINCWKKSHKCYIRYKQTDKYKSKRRKYMRKYNIKYRIKNRNRINKLQKLRRLKEMEKGLRIFNKAHKERIK